MSQLRTFEGELLHLSVSVGLKDLEGLLTALAELPFPVNPEIMHLATQAKTVDVVFPAYERRMPGIVTSLEQAGFARELLQVRAALSA